MKRTVLELVNSVLNALDADAVNSIDDTTEARQVADILRDTYYAMQSNRNWASNKRLIQFDNILDSTKPNYLKVPEGMKELIFFRYDCTRENSASLVYNDVKYLAPEKFLQVIAGRSTTNPNVLLVTDFSGSKLPIATNQPPSYWTTFDDTYIVTDAYDSEMDDTLKGDKVQALAYMAAPWVHLDDAVPDLPVDAFAALLNEVISVASLTLKQMANQKAEQESSRQQRWLSRKNWRTAKKDIYPNYGRKARR